MGRPPGPPKSRKDFQLLASQVQVLEALIDLAPFGKPSFVSVVRQAIDQFIEREMAKPGVREQVEARLKQSRKVVNLQEVRKDK